MNFKGDKIKYSLLDKIYITYIIIYANIFVSPIFSIIAVPIVQLSTLFLFLISIVILLEQPQRLINKSFVIIFVFTFIMYSITSIYYNEISVYRDQLNVLFVLAIFFIYFERYNELFIKISTIFIFVLIIGSYIGFFYAYTGGQPLFKFRNPDTRFNYVYLTTFTNGVFGNIIRPSGIYDEPGALSFFICVICLLRTLFKKNDNLTFLLLLFGNITFSFTHAFVFLCFTIYYLQNHWRKKQTVIYVILFTIILSAMVIILYKPLNEVLFSRFKFDSSSGTMKGDNRSEIFKENINILDSKIFFWGVDRTVFTDFRFFSRHIYYAGENPLTPLVLYGIFSSWLYYLSLLIIFIAGLINIKYRFIFISICILYFQRPFISTVGYNFYLVLFLVYARNIIKTNKGVNYAIRRYSFKKRI